MPFTMPELMPIVATAGLLLFHTPPGVALLKAMVVLTQWLVGPLIGLTTGTGFIVMGLLVLLVPQILLTV